MTRYLMRLLRDQGLDVNAHDHRGRTPLYFAARHAWLKITRILLEQGADASTVTEEGLTALHGAVYGGHKSIVRLMLRNGAESLVDVMDHTGSSALHIAASRSSLSVVKTLLDLGADSSARNKKGQTPFTMAAASKKFDIADLLDQSSVEMTTLDAEAESLMHKAAKKGEVDIVEYLLGKGVPVDLVDEALMTPLHAACSNDNPYVAVKVAQLLLDHGADVNAVSGKDGKTAIMLASEAAYWNSDVVSLLLEKGADVNVVDKKGQDAISYAVYATHSKTEVVQLLLNHGAQVGGGDRQRDADLLRASSKKPKGELLKLLADSGADLTSQDSFGRTTLHAAVSEGVLEHLEALLEEHSIRKLYRPDKLGMLPIHYFNQRRDDGDLLVWALRYGMQIDPIDNWSWTPLHWAAHVGNFDHAKALIDKGASKEAKDWNGWTPYYVAVCALAFYRYQDLAFLRPDDMTDVEASRIRPAPYRWASCDYCGVVVST